MRKIKLSFFFFFLLSNGFGLFFAFLFFLAQSERLVVNVFGILLLFIFSLSEQAS